MPATTVAVRRSWGAISSVQSLFTAAPNVVTRNTGLAVSVTAGAEGACIRHIRADRLIFDNVPSFTFQLIVFQGELPSDISRFQDSATTPAGGRFPISQSLMAAQRGVELLYWRYMEVQSPSISTSQPGVNVFFADGYGPSVPPFRTITTLLCPVISPTQGGAGIDENYHCNLNVLGGVMPEHLRQGANQLGALAKGAF